MDTYINNEAMGDDTPATVNNREFRIKYVATDGWRGYYSAIPTKKSGWVAIDSDWVTGNWDDAGENSADATEQKMKKLVAMVEEVGGEFIMILLPTSNCFSTAYDCFVRGISERDFQSIKAILSSGSAE